MDMILGAALGGGEGNKAAAAAKQGSGMGGLDFTQLIAGDTGQKLNQLQDMNAAMGQQRKRGPVMQSGGTDLMQLLMQ